MHRANVLMKLLRALFFFMVEILLPYWNVCLFFVDSELS